MKVQRQGATYDGIFKQTVLFGSLCKGWDGVTAKDHHHQQLEDCAIPRKLQKKATCFLIRGVLLQKN